MAYDLPGPGKTFILSQLRRTLLEAVLPCRGRTDNIKQRASTKVICVNYSSMSRLTVGPGRRLSRRHLPGMPGGHPGCRRSAAVPPRSRPAYILALHGGAWRPLAPLHGCGRAGPAQPRPASSNAGQSSRSTGQKGMTCRYATGKAHQALLLFVAL